MKVFVLVFEGHDGDSYPLREYEGVASTEEGAEELYKQWWRDNARAGMTKHPLIKSNEEFKPLTFGEGEPRWRIIKETL